MSVSKIVIPVSGKSILLNDTPVLICQKGSHIWQNLSPHQQSQTLHLINELLSGKPYPLLGGKKVKSNNMLVRFRVGRNHRLIFVRSSTNFVFQLFNRQNYEQNFNKNFSALSV